MVDRAKLPVRQQAPTVRLPELVSYTQYVVGRSSRETPVMTRGEPTDFSGCNKKINPESRDQRQRQGLRDGACVMGRTAQAVSQTIVAAGELFTARKR